MRKRWELNLMKQTDLADSTIPGRRKQAQALSRESIAVLQCLVVSVSQARRNLLSQGAEEAGWQTVICRDANQGLANFRRTLFRLALVDLDHQSETPPGFRELCKALVTPSSKMLLGICGREGQPEEEIWARQLGVWLYLPGVTSASEIAWLCEQAREIAERS